MVTVGEQLDGAAESGSKASECVADEVNAMARLRISSLGVLTLH
jgi:hypothetical protein